MKRLGKPCGLFAFSAFALLLSGCSVFSLNTSNDRVAAREIAPSWEVLPYHVAVIPLHADNVAGHAAQGAEFQLDYMNTDRESGNNAITEAVVEVLKRNVFVKVTTLTPPGSDMSVATRDAFYAAQAKDTQADLVLSFDKLEYNPEIDTKANPWSYLWYLTGPIELLIEDRVYKSKDTSLAITLYDTTGLNLPEEIGGLVDFQLALNSTNDNDAVTQDALRNYLLKNRAQVVRQFRLKPDKISLRYQDRVPEGSAGFVQFWKAILLPSSWLYKKEPTLADDLTDRFAMGLANDLASEIVEGDHVFIVHPDVTSSFQFDPRGLTMNQRGNHLIIEHQIKGEKPNELFGGASLAIGGNEFECVPLQPGENFTQVAQGNLAAFRTEATTPAQDGLWNITFYIPTTGVRTQIASVPRGSLDQEMEAKYGWLKLNLQDYSHSEISQTWTYELPPAVRQNLSRSQGRTGSGTRPAN